MTGCKRNIIICHFRIIICFYRKGGIYSCQFLDGKNPGKHKSFRPRILSLQTVIFLSQLFHGSHCSFLNVSCQLHLAGLIPINFRGSFVDLICQHPARFLQLFHRSSLHLKGSLLCKRCTIIIYSTCRRIDKKQDSSGQKQT